MISINEWKKLYKKVKRCTLCRRYYGTDIKQDNGLCYECQIKTGHESHRYKPRWSIR